MNIAYLIIAHKNPTQLSRLVSGLSHPEASFYIHIDKKVDVKPFLKECERLGGSNVHFVKERYFVQWGGYSMILATLSMFREAMADENWRGYLALMSGLDYPIKKPEVIHSFFKDHEGAEYLRTMPFPNKWWSERGEPAGGQRRYSKYHPHDYDWVPGYPIIVLLKKIANHTLPDKVFPMNLKVHCGPQWWRLSGSCVKYIIDFLDKNPKYQTFFRFAMTPDEYFFHSIIMNSPFKERVVNNHMTYIDWGDSAVKKSPKTLDKSDFESLKTSENLFARKFDIEYDSRILDMIDTELLGIGK